MDIVSRRKSSLNNIKQDIVPKNTRYSLRQYEEVIKHMWTHSIDLEHRNEVSDTKLVRFLRENKILTEKKQLDEMFKQCLF